jgi:hypothetical protein
MIKMSFRKLVIVLFLCMCLAGFSLSSVSAGTVHYDNNNKYGQYFDIELDRNDGDHSFLPFGYEFIKSGESRDINIDAIKGRKVILSVQDGAIWRDYFAMENYDGSNISVTINGDKWYYWHKIKVWDPFVTTYRYHDQDYGYPGYWTEINV